MSGDRRATLALTLVSALVTAGAVVWVRTGSPYDANIGAGLLALLGVAGFVVGLVCLAASPRD